MRLSKINMIQIIWEYKVKPEQAAKFEEAYGKNGEWDKLFKQSKAYKGTELVVKDLENQVYMTIDSWKSLEQYEQFIQKNSKEYKRLDKKFNNLTLEEKEIGIFNEE